jgi:hypothetical protein
VVAATHQSGTKRAGKDHDIKIPARPIVDATEADAELFSEIVSKYVFGIGLGVSDVTADAGVTDTADVGL